MQKNQFVFDSDPDGSPARKTVVVRVPASVAYDYKKISEATQIVLGKLGCVGCTSGWDIRFDIERS